MIARPPEPSFYPLPDLAVHWGCSLEQVLAYEALDGLNVTELPLFGSPVRGVLRGDVQAFEAKRERPKEPRYNRTERDSHLLLIAALAVGYTGGDASMLGEPGRLVSDLEKCAAANGAPMPRGYDTNTNAIREALELLEMHGYQHPRKSRPISEVGPLRSAAESSEAREARA